MYGPFNRYLDETGRPEEFVFFEVPGFPSNGSGYVSIKRFHPVEDYESSEPCEECADSPETGTIHTSCLNLYSKLAVFPASLGALWLASISIQPWARSPVLPAFSRPSLGRFTDRAIELADIPGLRRLPQELVTIIMEHCEPSELLHLCAVEDTVDTLSRVSMETEVMGRPLQCVQSWRRGSRPTLTTTLSEDPMRITIDHKGIKCLERLSHDDPVDGTDHTGVYYAVVKPEIHDKFIFQVCSLPYTLPCSSRLDQPREQFGIFRVFRPRNTVNWPIWDIAKPFSTSDCSLFNVSTMETPELKVVRTVQLSGCWGLTFFISGSATMAVHVHTYRSPTADATFRRIPTKFQRHISWVYIPIPRSDPLTKFGVRPFSEDRSDMCTYLACPTCRQQRFV